MADFMRFAREAIETAREAGKKKREHALELAGIRREGEFERTERTQEGLTRRAGMPKPWFDRRHEELSLRMQQAGLTERAGMQPEKGAMTSSQMASIKMRARESAIKQLTEEWVADDTDPLTKKAYTSEMKKELIDDLTKSNVEFMIGEQAVGGMPKKERTVEDVLKGITVHSEGSPIETSLRDMQGADVSAFQRATDRFKTQPKKRPMYGVTGDLSEGPRTLFSSLQESQRYRTELEQASNKARQKFFKDVIGTGKYIAKDPRAAIRRTAGALRIY